MSITLSAKKVWRNYVTDGDSGSGAHPPIKSDIQVWGQEIEQRQFDTRALFIADTMLAGVNAVRTQGYTTTGDGGGATYKRVGSEPSDDFKVQSADATWWEGVYSGFLTPEMFGALGDGATDDSTAAQNMFDYLNGTLKGGRAVFLNKTYLFSSQVTISGAGLHTRMVVEGYGAVITTDAAISGLKILGNSTVGGITINGLKIDQSDAGTATFGFELLGTWNAVLRDCIVEADDVAAAYEAYHLANSTPSDSSTGSFWTTIDKCWVRRFSSGSGTRPAVGIGLWGTANATTIVNCAILDCDDGIVLGAVAALDQIPNGVLISGCDIEGITNAGIRIIDTNFNKCATGLRIMGNRFEDMAFALDLSDCNSDPPVNPMMIGNFYVSSVTAFLDNGNGINVTIFEPSGTPSNTSAWKSDTIIEASGGSAHPLTLIPVGGGRGLKMQNPSGDTVILLSWNGSGKPSTIQGGETAGLTLKGLNSLSRTTVAAKNLRSSATFSTSGTVSVSFGTAEADASYFIVVTGNVDENFWVTSKGTGGFTLNSDNASSVAVVDWFLIR